MVGLLGESLEASVQPCSPQHSQLKWLPWLGLTFIIACGTALRLGYFLNGDPFVDEWATMVVARSIWERGIPVLPSGTFYGHGMLYSYLDALFLGLLGWNTVVAQLPSLIAGLLTIPLAYLVGRQLFPSSAGSGAYTPDRASHPGSTGWLPCWRSELVGLLSAALMALDPVAVLWAGRARAYTLEQLLVLLAILWFYKRRFLLFALAFLGAMFSHTEALLLLPGFALGLLLMEGWTILRQWRVWLAFAVSAAAAVVLFVIEELIIPGHGADFQTIDSRPTLQFSIDILAGLDPLLPFFTEPYRIVVTLFFLIGLACAVRAWRQDRSSAYLLLYPLFLGVLTVMLTFIGQSWKDPRYLLMLLPAFFLSASAAAVDVGIAVMGRRIVPAWAQTGGIALIFLLLLLPVLPEALNTTDRLEEGYGPTLAYVRDHWRADDQVAGWAAPAIAMELGRIDYFAIQKNHEEFLMQKDGIWVDRWVGAPLMDSVEQLEAVLDEPGRLWFLTDEFRFRTRYTPEFAQAIWDRMEPVFRYHYALAFVERPIRPVAYSREVQARFEHGLDLVGYDLSSAQIEPGEPLTVTLHWQARDWVDAPYTAFVHLLDPNGRGVAQADEPPFAGLHPTDHWQPGERLRDERLLTVPADAQAGRYALEVGWYDPSTQERLALLSGADRLLLAYVPLGAAEVTPPGTPVHATLDGQVQLVGYDLWRQAGGEWLPLSADEPVRSGERLKVRLVWRALAEMAANYTVFVHLEKPGGDLWGQRDGQPSGGAYPTSYWRPGELVADEHEFVVDGGGAGTGQLLAGMYHLETMQRLGQPVLLRPIEVTP